MKIKDILLENDSLLSEASFLDWLKGKFTSDPIADKFRAAAARRNTVGLDAFGGKGADVSKAVAKLKAAPAPRGGGADRMPVAKTKKAPTPMDAGEFAGTPVAKTKKAPTPMDAGEFAGTPVAKTKKSAIVNPGAKAGQTPSAAGEFGSNKPRANIASTTNMSGAATNPQASAKFDQSKPTAVAKPAKKIGIQPGKTPSADTMDNRNK